MLVVIGIIGILISVLVPSYFFVQQMAWQNRAQQLVSNAATALTLYIQREQVWHDHILESLEQDRFFDWRVCKVLYEAGLLDVTMKMDDADGSRDSSIDKFGLLDPWGQALLRRNKAWLNKSRDEIPPELKKHLLQFRVDTDFNGMITASDFKAPPFGKDVRAPAIVWSSGPNGFESSQLQRYTRKMRLSWSFER